MLQYSIFLTSMPNTRAAQVCYLSIARYLWKNVQNHTVKVHFLIRKSPGRHLRLLHTQ